MSPGTEPVINQERMSVREKVDICQFEWYRDNEFVFITVSSIELGAVFLLYRKVRYLLDS